MPFVGFGAEVEVALEAAGLSGRLVRHHPPVTALHLQGSLGGSGFRGGVLIQGALRSTMKRRGGVHQAFFRKVVLEVAFAKSSAARMRSARSSRWV